jgi:hypothetical protein
VPPEVLGDAEGPSDWRAGDGIDELVSVIIYGQGTLMLHLNL